MSKGMLLENVHNRVTVHIKRLKNVFELLFTLSASRKRCYTASIHEKHFHHCACASLLQISISCADYFDWKKVLTEAFNPALSNPRLLTIFRSVCLVIHPIRSTASLDMARKDYVYSLSIWISVEGSMMSQSECSRSSPALSSPHPYLICKTVRWQVALIFLFINFYVLCYPSYSRESFDNNYILAQLTFRSRFKALRRTDSLVEKFSLTVFCISLFHVRSVCFIPSFQNLRWIAGQLFLK